MSYKKLMFKTNTTIEIENAIIYYTKINKSLPKKLVSEIRKSLLLISKNTSNFQFRYKKIQVFWLKKFPYGIYFIEEDLEIYIIAFWHSKQDIPTKLSKNL
jgi:plasmid stabilization system protein ParE